MRTGVKFNVCEERRKAGRVAKEDGKRQEGRRKKAGRVARRKGEEGTKGYEGRGKKAGRIAKGREGGR